MNFSGYNAAVDPNDLDPSESPDCMNVRPYKGRAGLLAPRPGYGQIASETNNILGLYRFNAPWAPKWMVIDNQGQVLEESAQETPSVKQFTGSNLDYTIDSALSLTYQASDGAEKYSDTKTLSKVLNVVGSTDAGPHGMVYLSLGNSFSITYAVDGVYPNIDWRLEGLDNSGNILYAANGTSPLVWDLGVTFPHTDQINATVTGYLNSASSSNGVWLPFKRSGLSSWNCAVYKVRLRAACDDWTEAASGTVQLITGTRLLFGEVP